MPATTMNFYKRYELMIGNSSRFFNKREDVAFWIHMAKEAHREWDVATWWTFDVDNGRGIEWHTNKWESMVSGLPGYEGV